MTGTADQGWLDWRHHSVGPDKPCRICAKPAICRDEHGRPCHKTCAEEEALTDQPAADSGGLVVDLDAYRTTRTTPRRRTA